MRIDFTSLNDVYHLAMIIIGTCGVVFAAITLFRAIRKDRKKKNKRK